MQMLMATCVARERAGGLIARSTTLACPILTRGARVTAPRASLQQDMIQDDSDASMDEPRHDYTAAFSHRRRRGVSPPCAGTGAIGAGAPAGPQSTNDGAEPGVSGACAGDGVKPVDHHNGAPHHAVGDVRGSADDADCSATKPREFVLKHTDLDRTRRQCAGGYWMPGEREWVEAMDSVTLEVDASVTMGQLMECVEENVYRELAAVVEATPQHSWTGDMTIKDWLARAGDRPVINVKRSKRDVSICNSVWHAGCRQ